MATVRAFIMQDGPAEPATHTTANTATATNLIDTEAVTDESSALDILQLDQANNARDQIDDDDFDIDSSDFLEHHHLVHTRTRTRTTAARSYAMVTTPFQEWIAERHLNQFASAFDDNGYADVELIRCLTQGEIEHMLSTAFSECR